MELLKADFVCLFTEALSAEHEVVLADQSTVSAALSAASRAWAVLADMSVLEVRHCERKLSSVNSSIWQLPHNTVSGKVYIHQTLDKSSNYRNIFTLFNLPIISKTPN